jgi:flagellar biosynthesis GTPase FlhF
MDDQDTNLQTPLIDDSAPASTSKLDNNDAMVLLNLEDMIKGNISQSEKLQGEIQEQKEMLDNVLANSETFREHSEAAKEANQIKSATRAEIMKQPSVMQVAHKVKDMKAELSEINASLSEYLSEYQRLAKTNIIQYDNGEEREIINSCKLIKRSSKTQ